MEQKMKKLGFGLMRLPMIGAEVDLEQTKQMADLFLEKGFTYFDTAYGYINGKSEEAVKEVLVKRHPRESFLLATKLPAWAGAKTAEEARQMFYTSLERTGAGYFDYYLLHNLGDRRTQVFEDFGCWEFAAELKKQGLIRHLGFSMHDCAEALDRVLMAHPEADFVQLQINYADWESPSVQSRLCYETARRHHKPVVIMEPVKGGSLATLAPAVTEPFRALDPEASNASWALRFAASLPGVMMVLSGMSTLEQMRDNVSFMADFKPLTEPEQDAVEEVRRRLAQIETVPCTGCGYCTKGCPQGIAIPGVFSALNTYLIYHNLAGARMQYGWAGGKADTCLGCGQCESVCPQHLSIIEELARAAELLGKA